MVRLATKNAEGQNMRFVLHPSALAVALLCVAPLPVAAQRSTSDDDFRSQARKRVGQLYLRPTVSLDKFGIETNVFNTPEEKSDFVVGGTPRLEAWLPVQSALISADVSTRMEYFQEYESERSLNPELKTRIEIPVRRLTLAVGGDYLRTRQRPTYELDFRARRVVTGFDAGIGVEVAPTLEVALEAARERTRFDADAFFAGSALSETLNRDEDSARIAARWRRTALSTFFVAGEYREAHFVESPQRDSANTIVTAGAEFHPRALISGSGQIGVRQFVARGTDVTDLTRMVAQADLTYRFQASTALTFDVERDIRYSFRVDDPFFVLTHLAVSLRRQLRDPFDVTASYSWDLLDYQGVTGRRDTVRSVQGILGYRLNASTRIGFRVRYIERDSRTDRWRYDGLEGGLVFDYGL